MILIEKLNMLAYADHGWQSGRAFEGRLHPLPKFYPTKSVDF